MPSQSPAHGSAMHCLAMQSQHHSCNISWSEDVSVLAILLLSALQFSGTCCSLDNATHKKPMIDWLNSWHMQYFYHKNWDKQIWEPPNTVHSRNLPGRPGTAHVRQLCTSMIQHGEFDSAQLTRWGGAVCLHRICNSFTSETDARWVDITTGRRVVPTKATTVSQCASCIITRTSSQNKQISPFDAHHHCAYRMIGRQTNAHVVSQVADYSITDWTICRLVNSSTGNVYNSYLEKLFTLNFPSNS